MTKIFKSTRIITTRQLTFIAMICAVTALLGLTPLGFIPIGLVKVTTMHIPTILAALIGGPVIGGICGFFFGCFSLFQNLTQPTLLSFMFYNPLVSVLPRILIGVFSGLVFQSLSKKIPLSFRVMITGIVGTATNTLFVLSLAYCFYAHQISLLVKTDAKYFFGGLILTNFPFELLLSCILVTAVGTAVLKYAKKNS